MLLHHKLRLEIIRNVCNKLPVDKESQFRTLIVTNNARNIYMSFVESLGLCLLFSMIHHCYVTMYSNDGQHSVDGTATRYGLDGRGSESRWGRDILYQARPALGPTQTPI